MSAQKLYTPELLGLTVELARYPAAENLPLHGEARAVTCGSTLALDLGLDNAGQISAIGMRVRACAIGQAAAAIFARHAAGQGLAPIAVAHDRIKAWLEGDAPAGAPDAIWPDLELLAQARSYPARHGAIMLPWNAALAALSSAPAAS